MVDPPDRIDAELKGLDPLADPGFVDRFDEAFDPSVVEAIIAKANEPSAHEPDRGVPSIGERRPARRTVFVAAVAAAALALVAVGAALRSGDTGSTVTDPAGSDAAGSDPADRDPAESAVIGDPAPTADDATGDVTSEDDGDAAAVVTVDETETGAEAGDGQDDTAAEPAEDSTDDSAEPGSAVGVTGPRDPMAQPFRWDSPWNMPIGDGAAYVPAGIEPPSTGFTVEEAIIVLEPDAPLVSVNATATGWGSGPPRCEALIEDDHRFGGVRVPIPDDFVTEGAHLGRYPGHAAAVVRRDGRTIKQSQPFHVCADGRAVSKVDYPDDDLVDGDGLRGAHGGSGLSSLGGTLRIGDLERGTINHALKVSINASAHLSPTGDGFRWPALRANDYATSPDNPCAYGGSVAEVRMGALLALRPGFDTGSMRTELGRMLAEAFVGYGGYVVNDACRDTFGIVTEWGPDGRVIDEVERRWDITMTAGADADCTTDTPDCRYARDMADIVAALQVIDNNGPTSPGGPGRRLAPCAASFADGSGGPPADSVCG